MLSLGLNWDLYDKHGGSIRYGGSYDVEEMINFLFFPFLKGAFAFFLSIAGTSLKGKETKIQLSGKSSWETAALLVT